MAPVSISPTMKWHNLNVGFKVSINSGAALLLYIPSLFALYFGACFNPLLVGLFPTAAGFLTGAFSAFLVKRYKGDQLDITKFIEETKAQCVPDSATKK